MRNLAVHWYEGLFLRAQHLQAAERYWTETLQTSHQWDNPYHYGLQAIEFSPEALANHQFEVHHLRARMRDGTLVHLQTGQQPDRIDLKEAISDASLATAQLQDAFEEQATVRVYLGVPKLRLGRANVGGDNPNARYQEAELNVADESRGGNEQAIQFRQLNAKLLLSTQDLSGYELLPIAQIQRAGAQEAKPQLDVNYIPPVLCVSAWPQLGRDIVRAIFDIVGGKVDVLSQQVVNRGIGLDSRDPGDLERILMLMLLNSAHSVLSVLAFAEGVHPLVAYTELCRLLGQLSLFDPARRPAEIPAYDHEDLHRIFSGIRIRIEQLIHSVRDYDYQQRYFVGAGMGMQAALESQWFNANWKWYIGVNKGELTTAQCRELLSPGHLDWKFGSSRQVDLLFTRRMQGLELIPVDRPERALPARPEWLYFEVPRRDAPAWHDVQQTQSLAVRLKDSLIMNQDRLQGERQLVVNYQGRSAPLQFALFAVPTES